MTTKVDRILAALRDGAATSQEIADQLGSGRSQISVALCRLAARGVIERAGVVDTCRIGRPHVRWRLSR